MSDVIEHLAFLVSRVRQCDHAFEVVTQGDDDTVLDMARLSNNEAYSDWLDKVDVLIGKSHKSYHHIAWRQMWESGKTLEGAVTVVRADRQTVRWEDV